MRVAAIHSRAQIGTRAVPVSVEVHASNGLPGLSIVGLPETAVRESKDRVRSAILNAGFEFPLKRITINLAPADLPKEGARFDLPIAIGILAASEQLPGVDLDGFECVGELALSGGLRPIRGALPTAMAAAAVGRSLLLPAECADEAALVDTADIRPAPSLRGVCEHLLGVSTIPPWIREPVWFTSSTGPNLAEVRGQALGRRALEVAAAGGHHLLYIGPPGAGKSMLAQRLIGILPPMSMAEATATAAVASVSRHGFSRDAFGQRPFRSPHHTSSAIALVGGGNPPRPGEISLAHAGVLFLDELPEFDRPVLEVLREPLESGVVTISRAAQQAEFPAGFQLVAAMNPCPCGYLGDAVRACRCTPDQIRRYQGRISGPLLDRIDLHVRVQSQSATVLLGEDPQSEEDSARVKERVVLARQAAMGRQGKANTWLRGVETETHCSLTAETRGLLQRAATQRGLSGRAVHGVLRVARTIADLGLCEQVQAEHLLEALGLRELDRRTASG